jgi:mycofactocin precursor peptide peptidase
VQMGLAEVGNTDDLAVLMPALRTHGVRPLSPSGVLGDPREASAEQGHELLAALIGDLVAAVRAWWGPP